MPFTEKTHTHYTQPHAHTRINYRAQALVLLTKQACFKCSIFHGYMRVKQPVVLRQTTLRQVTTLLAWPDAPIRSSSQPSSSLSSLGRNLYCCCRIWASFFRASSSSRSFLSISSWAAMIWEREQLTVWRWAHYYSKHPSCIVWGSEEVAAHSLSSHSKQQNGENGYILSYMR